MVARFLLGLGSLIFVSSTNERIQQTAGQTSPKIRTRDPGFARRTNGWTSEGTGPVREFTMWRAMDRDDDSLLLTELLHRDTTEEGIWWKIAGIFVFPYVRTVTPINIRASENFVKKRENRFKAWSHYFYKCWIYRLFCSEIYIYIFRQDGKVLICHSKDIDKFFFTIESTIDLKTKARAYWTLSTTRKRV